MGRAQHKDTSSDPSCKADLQRAAGGTVACTAHLLHALQADQPAEASGEDNLRVMQLVFSAYESAQIGRAITVERS